jgi:hypothetical protein
MEMGGGKQKGRLKLLKKTFTASIELTDASVTRLTVA